MIFDTHMAFRSIQQLYFTRGALFQLQSLLSDALCSWMAFNLDFYIYIYGKNFQSAYDMAMTYTKFEISCNFLYFFI